MAERDRRVLDALRVRSWPVALSMAGGYGHDINVTVALQHRTLELAAASWAGWAARAEGAAAVADPADGPGAGRPFSTMGTTPSASGR